MASERRQYVTLGGLLLVLAVVLWWQSRDTGVPAPAPAAARSSDAALAALGLTPAAAPGAPPAKRPAEKVPAVALSRLQGARPDAVNSGRDPFRFGVQRRPGTPSGAQAGDAMPGPGAVRAPTAPAPPANSVAAAPPPIALKFIGIVKRSEAGVVLAVLSDGKGVYYGTEGDVIEGRYRILKIGNESVEMAYLDGRGQQRIPLSGA
ncbi:MAG: hypothetical protein AB1806_04900 [Acidobacteriota bacterium]